MAFVVDLGARCNNRCVHCALGDLRDEPRDPGLAARARAELAAGRARGAASITFVGGEPTLHDELCELAAHARALGYTHVQVQTNARRLAYESYARALVASGVDQLDVALYGPTPAVHDYHTRVRGSHEQTVAGLRHARAAGAHVGVTVLATRSSWRDLPETVALAIRSGAARVHLAMTLPRGAAEAAFDRVVPRLGALDERLREAIRLCRAARVPVVVSGFPACVLGDDAGLLHPEPPRAVDHVHGAPCETCTWRERCPGVPGAYAARVNLAELRPRRDPPAPRDATRDRARDDDAALARAAAAWFVGATRVEPERPERRLERAAAADPALVQLRALGATNPGRNELRAPAPRKTGKELEALFPSLFGGAEPPSGRPGGGE